MQRRRQKKDPERRRQGREEAVAQPRQAAERHYSLKLMQADEAIAAGEVVFASRWDERLVSGLTAEGLDFRIILLSTASALKTDALEQVEPGVAICVPARPVQVATQLSEAAAVYETPAADGWRFLGGSPNLSRQAVEAFARGRTIASGTEVSPGEVFVDGCDIPDFPRLAQALIEVARRYQDDLYAYSEALAVGLSGTEADSGSLPDLSGLLKLLREQLDPIAGTVSGLPSATLRLIEGELAGLAAASRATSEREFVRAAQRYYPQPEDLMEAVALARALARGLLDVGQVAWRRAYLKDAIVPQQLYELALDREVSLAQLSYTNLIAQPEQVPAALSYYEHRFWKPYIAAYQEHHRRYWEVMAALRQRLTEAAREVAAIRRLNIIDELGSALGEEALQSYERLLEDTQTCSVEPAGLREMLRTEPRCPACGISLTDAPDEEAVASVLREVRRVSQAQLQRLSQYAVQQLLARSREPKLEVLMQVAAAGDLSGLLNVLDDEVVAFIRRLLSPPRVALRPLLERLERTYPNVAETEVESLLAEFRQMLHEAMQAERGDDRS